MRDGDVQTRGSLCSRGRPARIVVRDERGQGTLEYALVLLAFTAMLVGLGALWHAGRDGLLLRLALDAASHALEVEGALGSARDVLLY